MNEPELHASLVAALQKMADEHGVFVMDISVDWLDVSSVGGNMAEGKIRALRIVSQSVKVP